MTIAYNKVTKCHGMLGIFAFLVLAGSFVNFFQPVEAGEKYWSDPVTGYALGGYDVVSYWSSTGPVLGRDEFEVQIEKTTWRFANQGNSEQFLKHINVYAPQFSGYGAYAVSQGKAPRGNPKIWVITGNKLYFFFSEEAKIKWGLAREKFLRKAAEHWPVLKRQIAQIS